MSRYRKVDPRIWNDEKFRSLSDDAKLVFFMLLTHPNMTALGAMRATVGGLAEEMGWGLERFREAFREALSKGMAEHDQKACLVMLPKFLKYNPPESPNVVKAWADSLDLLPECGLKTRVITESVAFLKGKSKAFQEALPEAFAKTMPNQEQEQEQDLSLSPRTSGRLASLDDARRFEMHANWQIPENFHSMIAGTVTGGLPTDAELNRFRSYHTGKGLCTDSQWANKLIADLRMWRASSKPRTAPGTPIRNTGADHDRPAVESM